VVTPVSELKSVSNPPVRIIATNNAYCTWSNADRAGIIGRHCYEVSHKTLQPCYVEGEECALKRIFETGEPDAAMHKRGDRIVQKLIQTFSTISHTPQGQMPAQKPQPIHLSSSTTYS
jgi:hypothetical protein